VTGKPSPEFFLRCVGILGLPLERVALDGDDWAAFVLAGP